jgi:hypothetical protein
MKLENGYSDKKIFSLSYHLALEICQDSIYSKGESIDISLNSLHHDANSLDLPAVIFPSRRTTVSLHIKQITSI